MVAQWCMIYKLSLQCSATYFVSYIVPIKKVLLYDLQSFLMFLQHSMWDENVLFADVSNSNGNSGYC